MKTNFKKGDLVKINSKMIDNFRKTESFEKIAIVERNISNYSKLQNLKNYPNKVTLIFAIKGEYNIDEHGLSIGNRGKECRIDVLREKIEKLEEKLISPAIFYSSTDYSDSYWKSISNKFGYIKLRKEGDMFKYKQTIFPSKVGENYQISVGAPGIGYIKYKITKIDKKGMWGVIIENTVRILEPYECI